MRSSIEEAVGVGAQQALRHRGKESLSSRGGSYSPSRCKDHGLERPDDLVQGLPRQHCDALQQPLCLESQHEAEPLAWTCGSSGEGHRGPTAGRHSNSREVKPQKCFTAVRPNKASEMRRGSGFSASRTEPGIPINLFNYPKEVEGGGHRFSAAWSLTQTEAQGHWALGIASDSFAQIEAPLEVSVPQPNFKEVSAPQLESELQTVRGQLGSQSKRVEHKVRQRRRGPTDVSVEDPESPVKPVTTFMLGNLPYRVKKKDITDALDSMGFNGAYDFCHLPNANQGRPRSTNLGYAFVGFFNAEFAAAFEDRFSSFPPLRSSGKRCTLKPADWQRQGSCAFSPTLGFSV
mmetsp:Transcript_64383/g.140152  ORF Transcript_64383/g.140152 Transcript_64383/m.140152 type:complete len:347 (-) Transcript_64383:324-1364(-)|eukprot:CAMPEP_0170610252 /NCGR_PEP_ID=MMETSP0224-20130122/22557_1 /TAXON_ID=285029 /ORGANISM="Togula jolla, Strain CCCM 725" /LENGTH=346 /DNA_ID=CAMNT_0010935609 /DNA_START=9 /DNA_END=1049 /DNA_ORIENTATION=+